MATSNWQRAFMVGMKIMIRELRSIGLYISDDPLMSCVNDNCFYLLQLQISVRKNSPILEILHLPVLIQLLHIKLIT